MATTKGAIIGLIGKPNVGKSTLFNSLQTQIYAIVSQKPQTTRNYLISKYQLSDEQEVVIIDTPGFHPANNKLDMFLNSEVKFALRQAEIICFIFDSSKPLDQEDLDLINLISQFKNKQFVLIANKIDAASESSVDTNVTQVTGLLEFGNIVKISALQKTNLSDLIDVFKKLAIYEDLNLETWQNPKDEFIAKEIVRESCLILLKQEVPYGINVLVNTYEYNKTSNQLLIDADIYVEKESQKAIVIGKAGQMIKQIGIRSREQLLKLYECKIVLKLFVKVKKDWRENDNLIIQMGYKKNDN